jgi:hypothetical protein
MRVSRSGKPSANVLLDMLYDPGATVYSTSGAIGTSQALALVGNVAALSSMIALGGTAVPVVGVQTDELTTARFTPAAGGSSRMSIGLSIPAKRNWALVNAFGRRRRIHTFEAAVKRATPVIVNHSFEFGFSDDPGAPFSTSSGGILITANSTLNAGVWSAQYKIPGGAVQTPQASAVSPDGTYQHLMLKYYDADTAKCEAYINGSLFYTFVGATLPDLQTGEPYNAGLGNEAVGLGGQSDDMLYWRYRIEEV